jgi:hypothetical protein
MTEVDFHIILNTIIGMAFTEVIIKPVVVRLTKKALKWADKYIHLIPDFLHHAPSSSHCPKDI